MPATHLKEVSSKATPQTESIPGRDDQVKNNAGGYGFMIDPMAALDRFLILGTEGGTYYVSERKSTLEATKGVIDLIKSEGRAVVDRVVEISKSGRAPRNDYALFVLALCASEGDKETRGEALSSALRQVARTGTHLFQFVAFVEQFRGWGRLMRNGIASWYANKSIDELVYQGLKYQQRDGWSHRDLFRLCHVKTSDPIINEVYAWVVGKNDDCSHPQIQAVRKLHKLEGDNVKAAPGIIMEHRLTREMIPSELLNDKSVWAAMLPDMPVTAMIRNLAKMTSVGLLKPMEAPVKTVVSRLTNGDLLKEARVHPLAVLSALYTYKQGRGMKGKLEWKPNQQIRDALEEAFYLAFGAVQPAGKRTLLAIDVSGSMWGGNIAGLPFLKPATASAVMAMVTARTEPDYHIFGFNRGLKRLDITKKTRLEDVDRAMREHYTYDGTDCSLAVRYALDNDLDVDTFVVYTDNETWAGKEHPCQALKRYRKKTGIEARMVVVAMTATKFTIADPTDAGMLDVVGFDTAAPNLISAFSRGDF